MTASTTPASPETSTPSATTATTRSWKSTTSPRRSQRTTAVLTFFAQDHASSEMVYANADITKAEQAAEIIAFADYWQQATGSGPGLLVFDSQLTTYKILDELTSRGINWLTLRQRGKNELARLAALPASAWKTATISRYRRPRLHEDMIKLTDVSSKVRQIAVTNIGRDEPTLLITHDLTTPARDLFARYAERMMVENELDAYIGGFHLDALTSGVPLNVDLDTTLTVIAGNLCRLLASSSTDTTTPPPTRSGGTSLPAGCLRLRIPPQPAQDTAEVYSLAHNRIHAVDGLALADGTFGPYRHARAGLALRWPGLCTQARILTWTSRLTDSRRRQSSVTQTRTCLTYCAIIAASRL
jgi:hypothetical protein